MWGQQTLYDYEVALYAELKGSNAWNGSVLGIMLLAGTAGALAPSWRRKQGETEQPIPLQSQSSSGQAKGSKRDFSHNGVTSRQVRLAVPYDDNSPTVTDDADAGLIPSSTGVKVVTVSTGGSGGSSHLDADAAEAYVDSASSQSSSVFPNGAPTHHYLLSSTLTCVQRGDEEQQVAADRGLSLGYRHSAPSRCIDVSTAADRGLSLGYRHSAPPSRCIDENTSSCATTTANTAAGPSSSKAVSDLTITVRAVCAGIFCSVALLLFVLSWQVVAAVLFLSLFFFAWQYITVTAFARLAIALKNRQHVPAGGSRCVHPFNNGSLGGDPHQQSLRCDAF